nr:hypothetical protein Itr_chr03CG07070 [Ipomoea trifida]
MKKLTNSTIIGKKRKKIAENKEMVVNRMQIGVNMFDLGSIAPNTYYKWWYSVHPRSERPSSDPVLQFCSAIDRNGDCRSAKFAKQDRFRFDLHQYSFETVVYGSPSVGIQKRKQNPDLRIANDRPFPLAQRQI